LRRAQSGSSRKPSVSLSSYEYHALPGCWNTLSTTPPSNGEAGTFEVTHSFHPLKGKIYPLVKCHRNWGEERVYYQNEAGELCSLPLTWTNLAKTDLFVQISAGRSAFRVTDLLELARLLAIMKEEPEGMK